MSGARTLWEEGHEPGRQVVALGLALALTDRHVDDCLAVALLVRPEDFFTAGVLPPLIMLTVVVLVGLWERVAIAPAADGLGATVLTGLARHAVALGVGYAVCLACLAVRDQVASGRRS